MWRGFSSSSLLDLSCIKADPLSGPAEVAKAARALAVWFSSHGDHARGLDNVCLARRAQPDVKPTRVALLLEADALVHEGFPEAAREVLDEASSEFGEDSSFLLAQANTWVEPGDEQGQGCRDDDERLRLLNQVYEDAGVGALARVRPDEPLSLLNLALAAKLPSGTHPTQTEKVSVLIPAYGAEETLHIALDSLLAQSWRNIEVLVCDDCSRDGTYRVAQEYAAKDSRVIALQLPENSGAYAARNFALAHAVGDYVTVHDVDDYSHPEKLERQLDWLRGNPEQPGVLSDWARCYLHLFFRPAARAGRPLVSTNHSSLMIRRELLKAMGGWDEVRIAADSELLRRLEARFGVEAIHRIHEGVPLSFGLERSGSLTHQSVTHIFTLFYGVRQRYHESARVWRETKGQSCSYQLEGQRRTFPAPGLIEPVKKMNREVDVLVLGDFSRKDAEGLCQRSLIGEFLKQGKKVAVFHHPDYEGTAGTTMVDSLLRKGLEEKLLIVAPGEKVSSDLVLSLDPGLHRFQLDMPLQLTCRRFVLLLQAGQLAAQGALAKRWCKQVMEGVSKTYGIVPGWAVRLAPELVEARALGLNVFTSPLPPVPIQAELLPRKSQHERPPVLGCLLRQDAEELSESPSQLLRSYCAGESCEVRFLGNLAPTERLLGRLPKNWSWREGPLAEPDLLGFLSELDFLLVFPAQLDGVRVSSEIMLALSLGLPVVLPPGATSVLGKAVMYAEPEQVWDVVSACWEDSGRYQEQVEAGREWMTDVAGQPSVLTWMQDVSRSEPRT